MRSSERLFNIILILRRGHVMTGQYMARELGVSLRTIYRDMRALMLCGVPIEGEAGVGFSLRREFYLPPLMLTSDEVHALALGARMVRKSDNDGLGKAADDAMTKIELMLPEHLKTALHARPDSQILNGEVARSRSATNSWS